MSRVVLSRVEDKSRSNNSRPRACIILNKQEFAPCTAFTPSFNLGMSKNPPRGRDYIMDSLALTVLKASAVHHFKPGCKRDATSAKAGSPKTAVDVIGSHLVGEEHQLSRKGSHNIGSCSCTELGIGFESPRAPRAIKNLFDIWTRVIMLALFG